MAGMNTLRRERNAWQNSFFIRVAFILGITENFDLDGTTLLKL